MTVDDLCTCGKPVSFDPNMRGVTVGGHHVIGALVCPDGHKFVCKESRSADSSEAWVLAKGGRSLTIGGVKIRAESAGPGENIAAIMARIVRVPELEAEVERLRAMLNEKVP